MVKPISTRQASLIIMIAMLSTKLLSLNSIISYVMANNAWVIFFVSLVVDILFSAILIYLIYKIDMPILEYIKLKFGFTASIVISILVGLMFLFKTTQIMVDIYLFFVQLIYVEISRFIFVICFIIILFYFGSRYMQSIGRTIELLLYLIMFSLVLSLIISVKAINLENLLPFANINISTASKNIFNHNLWFGDFWFLFFMIGNIKKEKDTGKKILWSYIISSIIILLFVIVFTCVFGETASLYRVCVIDITEVMPRLTNQARFNWLVDFTFPIVLVLGLGLHGNCVSICLKHIIKNDIKSKNTVASVIMTSLVLAVCIIFRFTFTDFYNFVVSYFFYFNTFVQYFLPLIILIMIEMKEYKFNNKSYLAKNKNQNSVQLKKIKNKNMASGGGIY